MTGATRRMERLKGPSWVQEQHPTSKTFFALGPIEFQGKLTCNVASLDQVIIE